MATNVPLNVALFVGVNMAAIRLRQKEPDLLRPYRIPLYPLPVLLAVAINTTLLAALIYEDPLHSLEGFALLAAIVGVYAVIGPSRKGTLARTASL